MPALQPGKLTVGKEDWDGLQRQLNYIFKDIYNWIDTIQGVDDKTFSPQNVILPTGMIEEIAADVATILQTTLTVVEGMLAANSVSQAKFKDSTGEVTTTSMAGVNLNLPGGTYGFYPQHYSAGTNVVSASMAYGALLGGGYFTMVYLTSGDGNSVGSYQRYVTASGEIHWIFFLVDKATGKRIASYSAPDHPCFGNRGAVHPFPDYDPLKHEIIVVNPSLEIVKSVELARFEPDYLKPEKPFTQTFFELYEIDESKQADWPDIPITVGLPRVHNGQIVDDWRFMPRGTIVIPIKYVIPRPDYITPLAIRRKL